MPTPIQKCSSGPPEYDRRYFEELYRTHDDPWNVMGSAYEQDKYQATLRALRKPRYRHALELGCSIGGLTRLLAERCESLTSVDTSSTALEHARQHCPASHVRFVRAHLPDGDWQARYDLIVLSELLYYFTPCALAGLANRLRSCIEAGGTEFIMVHWIGETDYPLSGDVAAHLFLALMRASHCMHMREPLYRLDSWVAIGTT